MQEGPDAIQLQQVYRQRFAGKTGYRTRVWKILTSYFSKWVPREGSVLDLGAGYCEFINSVAAQVRFAMDLNPDLASRASPEVHVLQQDCSEEWRLAEASLDTVFTSNFLEHLPNKEAVRKTLEHAFRSIKPGGYLVAMGPNIKYVPDEYWDFFDHYVELTELSLAEAMRGCGFVVEIAIGRFMPYTMSHGRQYPTWVLQLYLKMPLAWRIFGKQFLVVARKPSNTGV